MLAKSSARFFGLDLLLSLQMVSLSLAQDTGATLLSSVYEANQRNCGYYSSSQLRSICSNQTKEEELISNGRDAQEGMFPSYVQLEMSIGFFLQSSCGGVLITNQHILTAAHCVDKVGPGQVTVYNGVGGKNDYRSPRYGVARVCSSRQYSNGFTGTNFDIAVLKLAQPASGAQPACLPWLDISYDQPAWAAGLGLSSKYSNPSVLQRLNVKRVPCSYLDTHMSTICFKATHVQGTVCQGDSGGPVYAIFNGRQTVVGLTSYGRVSECERRDHTAMFAHVYNLRDEIEDLFRECR